ncbi:MAG: hypothetical protein U9R32_07610 [Bacteroidota bacterium]|nr:hypothetical protein [Bacteroidota bacterium]
MKKRHYLFLVLAIIAVSVIYVFDKKNDLREEYENYLTEEFNKIPRYENKNLKGIPKMDRPDMAAIQDYYEIMDPQEHRVPVERLKKARKISDERQMIKSSHSSGIEWNCAESDMGGRTRSFRLMSIVF